MNDSVGMVSSVSKMFYERCGKNMVDSFLKLVSPDIRLKLYHEASVDGFRPDIDHPRVTLEDLHEVTVYREFEEKARPKVQAMIGKPPADPFLRGKIPGSVYDYLWDAISFGKKGLSWVHGARSAPERYLYWIDADVVFTAETTSDFLRSLLKGVEMVYYGREKMYTETGVYAIDRDSPKAMAWVEAYAACWEKAEIFKDRTGWTDCQAFDIALRAVPDLKKNNLSKADTGHVVPDSILGKYLKHLKGAKRKQGKE